jgi:hypothetical protein
LCWIGGGFRGLGLDKFWRLAEKSTLYGPINATNVKKTGRIP